MSTDAVVWRSDPRGASVARSIDDVVSKSTPCATNNTANSHPAGLMNVKKNAWYMTPAHSQWLASRILGTDVGTDRPNVNPTNTVTVASQRAATSGHSDRL